MSFLKIFIVIQLQFESNPRQASGKPQGGEEVGRDVNQSTLTITVFRPKLQW